ncbi:hypothetical protein [Hymenobacter convexus]|uniref:hypothetical protein n=1 Tax=Hymenobacter sp. CA1UV-4 TaxID=3063782 RepID=UPI00271280AC|nr:hypothetical protein [Hymenobacter sp. CA1UV-4]MDO7854087.1 hypothetical protein [Hymenobacter sp. CA1UV-4]
MQEITLKLTVGQINLLLEALGSQPYLRVYELIEVLQRQAQAQLGEPEPAGAPLQATSQS